MKVFILRIMFRPLRWVKGRGFHIRAQFPDYPIKKIRLDNAEELHLKHLITIACQSGLMLNIQLLIPILKMV